MDTAIERTPAETEFGFTWGTDGSYYYLRNPEKEFHIVPESLLQALKGYATDTSLPELQRQTERADAEAATTLQELVDRNYLRADAPIRRIEPPEDIALWPRLLGSTIVFVGASLIAFSVYGTMPADFLAYDLYSFDVIVLLAIVGTTIVIHELGHYFVARKHLDPRFDLTVKNAVLPAVVMRVNDVYVYPRNRSLWLALAGPTAGTLSATVIGLLHLLYSPHYFVGFGALLGLFVQLFQILPFVHGDGYELLVETMNVPNLRTTGIADLKAGRLTAGGVYVAISYGLPVVIFALIIAQAFDQGRINTIAPVIVLLALVFVWSNRDTWQSG